MTADPTRARTAPTRRTPMCEPGRECFCPIPAPVAAPDAEGKAMSERCARCGRNPAAGYATIGDDRYCHDGPDQTCYQSQSWQNSATLGLTADIGLTIPQGPGRWFTDADLAAHDAAVRVEHGERIAQAIEAACEHHALKPCGDCYDQATLARETGRNDG